MMLDAIFGRSQTPKINHQSMVPSYYLIIAVIIIAILAGSLLMTWIAPADGKDPFWPQIRTLKGEVDRQDRIIGVLKKENTELQQSVTKMKHLREIDRESLSRVQDQLKVDQNERLKMEEEVVFLRGLVSSKLGKGVLRLQRLRLQQGKGENGFLFSFTVSKVTKSPGYTEGWVYITLNGEQNGEKRTLTLKQVSTGEQDKLKMRFKHFQNMDGEFMLPARFKPSGVTIDVRPVGDKYKPVKKSFKWVVTG